MGYSSTKYTVAYEFNGTGGWTAVVLEPVSQRDTASRELARMKANEIVHPYRYRNIRLLQQITTVHEWEDISP